MDQIRRGKTRSGGRASRRLWVTSGKQPVASLAGIAIKVFGTIATSGVIGDEDTAADGSPSRRLAGLSTTVVRHGSP